MALMQVPVTKGKGTVEIDTDKIPEEVYAEALLQGLKVLVNRGASKVTKETYPDADELKAAAMAKAAEQVELINTGKIKFTGQKAATKASGAVMTEARRLARNIIKDEMKRQGIKISHVEASEITKAANALLAEDASIVEQAEANLKERAAKPVAIDVKAIIKTSPKKVAAAEERKAKAKKEQPLSATQAGKVATRAKGKGAQAQATQ